MSAINHPNCLQAKQAALLVVDIQERLVPSIYNYHQVVKNTAILIKACRELNIPVIVSEQYVKGLGPTVPTLRQLFHDETLVLEKTTFGALGQPTIAMALKELERPQIMVCGIETHVCVNQSVHQLLAAGYQPHVVEDAVSSRLPENKTAGLGKMKQSGAIMTTTEMAVFELLYDAKNPAFKPVQALIK